MSLQKPSQRHQKLAMSPSDSKLAFKKQFVGKTLYNVPTPSIVLDLAKLEVNCQRMTDAAEKNGIGWRAHIKTHKASPRFQRRSEQMSADCLARLRSSRGFKSARTPTRQQILSSRRS